jgi:Chromo (CHRromatin Organisation MOdifier) domain
MDKVYDMQYLIKWKGYPASENSWLLEKELTNAKELLNKFKQQEKHTPK